jgi:hypothetical protein
MKASLRFFNRSFRSKPVWEGVFFDLNRIVFEIVHPGGFPVAAIHKYGKSLTRR